MSDDTPSPLNNVITIDDERIKSHLERVVRGTVEETLNALLDAAMLKAIHASEDIAAAREKAVRVIEKLRGLRLARAAELVEAAIEETLAYYAFPEEHWRRIRTNNPLERILREIRRRTRVVGAFPDGQSALNLAAARLRHIAGTAWSTKRYLNIELLKDQQMRGAITA
jgi:putative transposase